jgi:hypothetical protein
MMAAIVHLALDWKRTSNAKLKITQAWIPTTVSFRIPSAVAAISPTTLAKHVENGLQIFV